MEKSLVFVVLSLCLACAHTPPNLSPAGTAAFHGTQVIKSLDVLRDVAIEMNAQVPSIVTTDTTRKVVAYHKSAITVIHGTPDGWRPTVEHGLTALVASLPADDRAKLAPYVQLAQTLITEVSK